IVHPETGVRVLNKVVEATADLSAVEVRPALEGKRMIMILGPKAGVVKRAAELRRASADLLSQPSAADLARLDEVEDDDAADTAGAADGGDGAAAAEAPAADGPSSSTAG